MDPTYKDSTEHVPDPDVGWSKMLRLDIATTACIPFTRV
jgi:hypothetical protein